MNRRRVAGAPAVAKAVAVHNELFNPYPPVKTRILTALARGPHDRDQLAALFACDAQTLRGALRLLLARGQVTRDRCPCGIRAHSTRKRCDDPDTYRLAHKRSPAARRAA